MSESNIDKGRLHYFEPATIAFDNKEGTNSDSITFPYDKYNIAVDLRVIVCDRYSCGLSNLTGESTEYMFSTTGGTLSFFGGTDKFLTTNYTDVQNVTPNQNTQECLGIESINISYDAWLHPTVVIKFVDVRGATVMQPAEQNYYTEGDQGYTYRLYKSLFTFPYPLFILKVKGFYGKGVTYRLAVNKVDIDFDSKNANFIITVNFIGHIYGLFADIPVSYMAVAPYTKDGDEYWNEMINDSRQTFWFHELDNEGNERPKCPMLKLPELAKKVAEVECAQNILNSEAETQRRMGDLDEQIQLLSDIILMYGNLFEHNYYDKSKLASSEYNPEVFGEDFVARDSEKSGIYNFAFFEDDSVHPTYSYAFIGGMNTILDDPNHIGDRFSAFINALEAYDEKFQTSAACVKNRFPIIDYWVDSDHDKHYFQFWKNDSSRQWNKWNNVTSNWEWYESDIRQEFGKTMFQVFGGGERSEYYSQDLYDFLTSCIKHKSYQGMTYFRVIVHDRGTTTKYKDGIELLSQIKSNLEKQREETYDKFKKENESLIEQALGFRPSIKNIFDLMFAHLDTFIHVYYNHLKVIKEELKNTDEKRKKTTYSIKDGFTDTEPAGKGLAMRGDYLPPFAGYYEEWKDENNSTVKKEMWPGKLPGNPEANLDEIKFVYDLLNGSKLYFEEMRNAEKTIEQYRLCGTTINMGGIMPTSDTIDFIPITTFDIANNGKYVNPYRSLAEKFETNADISEIYGNVYAIFALREYYYMNTIPDGDSSQAGYIGRIDAINFYKAVGLSNSRRLIEFIKKYADDSNISDEKEGYIEAITRTTIDPITSSWNVGENANNQLFKVTDNKISYNLSKQDENGFTYLPLHISGMQQLKNDFSSGNLRENKRYISTTNHGDFCGGNGDLKLGEPLNGGTFLLFESRNYVSDLFNNINAELTREKEETNNDDLKNLLNDVGNYEVKRGSKTYSNIANAIGSCSKVVNSGCFKKINLEKDRYDSISKSEVEEALLIEPSNDIFVESMDDSSLFERGTSIFDCDLYRLQDNILAKAYLFLQTAPMNGIIERDTEVDKFGLTDKDNALIQKLSLLREGAFYWWANRGADGEDDVFKKSGHVNEYVSELDLNKNPLTKRGNRDVSYILPSNSKTFFFSYTSSTACEFIICEEGQSDRYNTMIPRYGTTSRMIYLRRYFENWVLDTTNPLSFCNNISALENLKIRKGKEVNGHTIYTYNCKLDLDLLKKGVTETNEVMDAIKVQAFLRDLFFGVCTTFDYYHGFYRNGSMAVSTSDFKNGFRNFMDQLNKIYGEIANASDDAINRAFTESNMNRTFEDPFKSDDLRLSAYMTLKSLYDKWICGSTKGENTWKVNTKPLRSSKLGNLNNRNESGYINNDSGLYELDNFIYMDSLYRDIGHKLKVNLSKISDWLTRSIPGSNAGITENLLNSNSKSLYEFLTEVAQDCGGFILAIPQRFMYNNSDDIKTVFTPIPSCDQWDDNSYTYMFLYNYRPSEHLGDVSTSNMDMNGWSPDGDGFSLTDDEIIGNLFSGENDGYGVPAFGVTFGKGNQSYFKDIKLSTGQFGVTEAGLNATFQIASKASETIRQTTLYGQDIYKVYSNNAYECTVEMMGDMQIFPPMYFQLNNIPMWKGAYLIKKVTHVITPGDATTTIVGVRQNKYLVPFTNGDIVSMVEANPNDMTSQQLNIGGFIGETGGVVHQEPNHNYNTGLDESEFNPENITTTKPLICITPAHGPNTGKATEYNWSKKLIDDYIIPRLKEKKFKDGTSFANNIYRGNKNGANTDSKGYSMVETRKLVTKYGSDYVISVVPHWNGCRGDKLCVFYGQVNEANCTKYQVKNKDGSLKYDSNGNPVWWWKNCGAPKIKREDSKIFADYVRAAGEILLQNVASGKIKQAPDGMLNSVTYEDGNTDVFNYLLTPVCTDGAVMQNCPCILTENFFADYSVNGVSWGGPNYDALDGNNKYQTGRGWLESEEGLSAIADMHVLGIVNYINSLEEGGRRPSADNSVAYSGTYNIDNACNNIRTNIHNMNPNPSGHNNGEYDCAKHVRWAIEAGYGDANSTAGHPVPAKDYHNEGFLSRIGFYRVTSFKNNEIATSGYAPVKGDIAVYERPNNPPNEAGHICMYDGSNWYSYFKQNSIYCYGRLSGTTTINIYRINEA